MKRLVNYINESLFDRDLTTRKIGKLSVISSRIAEFLSSGKQQSYYDWAKCVTMIKKDINYKGEWVLDFSDMKKMKKDELYIRINNTYNNVALLGYGLTDKKSENPQIIILTFSKNFNELFVDIWTKYNGREYTLTDLLGNQWMWCKLEKDDISIFKSDVFNRIEQIF